MIALKIPPIEKEKEQYCKWEILSSFRLTESLTRGWKTF